MPLIKVAFRNKRGKFSRLSNAKYFYVYRRGKLLYRGEFLLVSEKIIDKELQIIFAVDYLQSGFEPKVIKPKPTPKKVAKKLKPKRHKPAKARIIRKSIFSKKFDTYARLRILEYKFKKPLIMTPRNIREVADQLKFEFEGPALAFYKKAKGMKMFIMRLMIDRLIAGSRMQSTGIGTARTAPPPFHVKNVDQFVELVLKELWAQFEFYRDVYLAGAVDRRLLFTGFSLENLESMDITTEELEAI